MNTRIGTIGIAAIIIVLLLVFWAYRNWSAEREENARREQVAAARQAEKEKPVVKDQGVAVKPELKVPEAPESVTPAETTAVPVSPERPAAPAPEEKAIAEIARAPEPPAPVVVPAPVADAKCKPDPLPLAKKRAATAPEGMAYVPGGVFTMGSMPSSNQTDEAPAHKVCLSGFYIDKYEVTNDQFNDFVEATGYVTDAEKAASSPETPTWRRPFGPDSSAEETPKNPVVCVSWQDANAYAGWAGKRLPTEAEWEKAARGIDGRMYPWGNQAPTGALANIADKSAGLKWSNASLEDNYKTTAPVGSFPRGKSVYGVEDMAGNVWEWCFDWWDGDYYRKGSAQNPIGPETGEYRVIRGGSWFYGADGARTTHRMYFRPKGGSATIGFRCVKDAG